jgi:tetratricopeptide (TPR) repeat protein
VFLGLMVGIKAYVNAKKREAIAQAAPKPDEILAQEFQEGITQFNGRQWERARAHFLKVLALAPSQGHVRQYVEQASAEIVARDALERARARLSGLDFAGARQELAKVKAASTYRADALALGRKIDEEQVKALVRTARALEQAGDTAGALQKVKEALALAPDRAEVQELHASLSGPARKGTSKAVEPEPRVALKVGPRTAPRPAPRVTKTEPVHRPAGKKDSEPVPARVVPAGAAKAAIALYKKRQWGPAYQALKEWADTQKGKKHKAALALAENVRLVGQSWTRAEQSRQPSQMLKYYNDALTADARVEKGPHQKALKELLVKAARMQASTAFTRKQYAEAYSAVKLAEKHGGKGDPGLQKVVQALNKQAEEIFNRAYTIRTSNLAQARRLWQDVLRMVPPTSAIYQKAYSWLNNSSPSYQDEDED